MGESIKIKVIYDNSRIFIRFNQGVSGTFDAAGVVQSAEQAARKRRLARAQIAVQEDDQPLRHDGCEGATVGQGGLFIRQVRAKHRVFIMGVMDTGHDVLSRKAEDLAALATRIRAWGEELGFGGIGISDVALEGVEEGLAAWLAAGFHGSMDYMEKHGTKRTRPAELVAGTRRVISVRMDYLSAAAAHACEVLADRSLAYVSRYALGRDYHKVLRQRLQKLADRISAAAPHGYRVFTDSAPVMEVALAEKAGLGWRGKHSLLLSREAGSFFFLGEIYTDLELPVDAPRSGHCGSCRACIDACPTGAIVAPYRVDARRCISYLTIELHGAIPEVYRPMIGNRVYGCDDCQWICPWNRFAGQASVSDFTPRNGLDRIKLLELFNWTPQIFNERMAGSPIFRIGYERWMRNLAVGLGNAPSSAEVVRALQSRRDDQSWLVREHVAWALERHGALRCGMSWQ